MKYLFGFVIIGLLVAWLGITASSAQSMMFVRFNSDDQTAYALTDVLKVSFNQGNIIVNKHDDGVDSFKLSNLRYLSFRDIQTNIPYLDLKRDFKFSVYPNPVSEHLSIQFQSYEMEGKLVVFEIIDVQGRLVNRRIVVSLNAQYSEIINVSHLPQGLYVCQIKYNGQTEAIKFIKQ